MEDVTNRCRGLFRVAAVGLLTAVAVCLSGVFVLNVQADGTPTPASSVEIGGVQAVAAMLGQNRYGLYLVDRDKETICVYQYVPRERKLKLTAVRRYTFDGRIPDNTLKEAQDREP